MDIDVSKLSGLTVNKKYRLGRKLGQGGFGAVFEADQIAFAGVLRKVAVKVHLKQLQDSEAAQFYSDTVLLANLIDQCPDESVRQHFVQIFDTCLCEDEGELKGCPISVIELVQDGSLADELRLGPFPLAKAVDFMKQILKAAAFMHQGYVTADGEHRPIVHADLKPDNILVKRVGEGGQKRTIIKVTDFGCAVDVEEFLPWAGARGSRTHLAPESFTHGRVSPSTDVYAMGLMFYEMLTGDNPFLEVGMHLSEDDEHSDKMNEIQFKARQAETFWKLDENVQLSSRPALKSVIKTALDPTDALQGGRYRDARQFEKALAQAAGEDLSAPAAVASVPVPPLAQVKQLVREAQLLKHSGSLDRAVSVVDEALAIMRDGSRFNSTNAVGEAFHLRVQLAIDQGDLKLAQRIAGEGYEMKPNRGSCMAMAKYYAEVGSPMARAYFSEAQKHQAEVL